jgi:hypothetical protein
MTLHGTLPRIPLYRTDHQIVIASNLRVEFGESSHQNILDLVLVGDEQVTVGTVTASFIHRHWLLRDYINEQQEIGVVCIGISNNDIDLRYRVIE